MTNQAYQLYVGDSQREWGLPVQQILPRRYDRPEAALYVQDEACGYREALQADVLTAAQRILRDRIPDTEVLSTPGAVKDYLKARLAALDHEVFVMMILDVSNRLVRYVELFRGTLTQTKVYPREVVKEALRFNAASVILAHNHPSGSLTPSRADEMLTETLKNALALVDVRVMDHIIVAGDETLSFAEQGLL